MQRKFKQNKMQQLQLRNICRDAAQQMTQMKTTTYKETHDRPNVGMIRAGAVVLTMVGSNHVYQLVNRHGNNSKQFKSNQMISDNTKQKFKRQQRYNK